MSTLFIFTIFEAVIKADLPKSFPLLSTASSQYSTEALDLVAFVFLLRYNTSQESTHMGTTEHNTLCGNFSDEAKWWNRKWSLTSSIDCDEQECAQIPWPWHCYLQTLFLLWLLKSWSLVYFVRVYWQSHCKLLFFVWLIKWGLTHINC